MTSLPKLIATDLDHTLLDSNGRVSARTRAALDAARAAGIAVVPVTARQPIGLVDLQQTAGFDYWAVCSNGAFATHLVTRELLFATEIPVATLRSVVTALASELPGVRFASVQHAGETLVAERGYAELASFNDHKRDPAHMGGVALSEVIAAPSLKLVARHPELTAAEIFNIIIGLGLPGFAVTLSGAPFTEIMADGINKATGLAQLCDRLGIAASEVVAFGDGLNDVEMLEWAGTGVAMGNADQLVREAANEVADTNDNDGVARVIERILAG